jgi:hypothetical protein
VTGSLLSRWPGGRVVAAVVGAVALAVTPLAGSAGAAPAPVGSVAAQPGDAVPGGFASWNELYAYQERLNAAAERITVASGGSAGVVASPINRELRVYWNGVVPSAVRTLAGGLGFPVVFESARYSQRLLAEQAQKMIGQPGVVVASPKADGSGLALTVEPTAGVARGAKVGAAVAAGELQAKSPVALTVTVGERPRSMAGRQADTRPFKGGARFTSSVGTCSTGLTIRSGAFDVMLTAGHCGSNNESISVPGQPSPAGIMLAKSPCRDTAVIDFGGGQGQVGLNVYTGPFNASTSSPVFSAAPDFVGNLVITGGASSGQHNNVQVAFVNTFVAIGGNPCASVGPLTGAGLSQIPTPQCAVAPGDSGGPVYTTTLFFGLLIARGTITASAGGTAQCPGPEPTGGTFVWYAPLLRPAGDAQVGSLNFHTASRPTAHGAFDLSGVWRGPGGGPQMFLSVAGNALHIDMSLLGRPAASGFILNATTIQVTFPDDRTYTGTIQSATSILWSNNTTWTKVV